MIASCLKQFRDYPRRKQKRYPRRATKIHEGPLRSWRRLKRDPPKVGKGERFPPRALKDLSRGRLSAKELQGVGEDSKGVREGPPRKTPRDKGYPPGGSDWPWERGRPARIPNLPTLPLPPPGQAANREHPLRDKPGTGLTPCHGIQHGAICRPQESLPPGGGVAEAEPPGEG